MDPSEIADWPSLAPQRALSARLGQERALAAWLAVQIERTEDPAFARLFSDHIDLPVAEASYLHRPIETPRGALLGGVRFYGQDVARPFVEVIAHRFDDLGALADAVGAEWRAFAPTGLRLVLGPEAAVGSLDVTVHAARAGAMAPPRGGVSLGPITPEAAAEMVRDRYALMAREAPALRRDVGPPAEPGDLRRWHEAGDLHGIEVRGLTVGLLATRPGAVDWIAGDVVAEEVVAAAHAGRGHAAEAQRLWAAARAPDRLLVGTIDAANHASRRTAERAGRPEVLRAVFLPLPGG